MRFCFVIQPFDKGTYDDRYFDTFKPAIEDAGLVAYRVDEDDSTRVPIESIQNKIRESAICLAEITTNKPNIWYELGYASACEKDVVMICSGGRTEKYPFDIQHRTITEYKTGSLRDYEALRKKIADRLIGLIKNPEKREKNRPRLFSSYVEENGVIVQKELADLDHTQRMVLTIIAEYSAPDGWGYLSADDLYDKSGRKELEKIKVIFAVKELLSRNLLSREPLRGAKR